MIKQLELAGQAGSASWLARLANSVSKLCCLALPAGSTRWLGQPTRPTGSASHLGLLAGPVGKAGKVGWQAWPPDPARGLGQLAARQTGPASSASRLGWYGGLAGSAGRLGRRVRPARLARWLRSPAGTPPLTPPGTMDSPNRGHKRSGTLFSKNNRKSIHICWGPDYPRTPKKWIGTTHGPPKKAPALQRNHF